MIGNGTVNGVQATREQIYAAVFAKAQAMQSAKTIASCSRRVEGLAGVVDTPVIFQDQKKENARKPQSQGEQYLWTLYIDWFIVIDTTENDDALPATQLNNILDAVEAAFAQPQIDGGRQTLGGLVWNCRIVGDIDIQEGSLGNKIVAVVPLEVIA